MTPDINWSLSGAVGAPPVYPGRLTAFRERSGRQAFPPVIALRLSVAQNLVPTLSEMTDTFQLATSPVTSGRSPRYAILTYFGTEMTETLNRSLPGRAGASPVYPGRFTASRERLGRQAFPPVIALRLSVAHNTMLSYAFPLRLSRLVPRSRK